MGWKWFDGAVESPSLSYQMGAGEMSSAGEPAIRATNCRPLLPVDRDEILLEDGMTFQLSFQNLFG